VAAVTIAGARHEPLMERDEFREQFWAAFDSFVETSPVAQASASRALA
jgi:lysophospholipase